MRRTGTRGVACVAFLVRGMEIAGTEALYGSKINCRLQWSYAPGYSSLRAMFSKRRKNHMAITHIRHSLGDNVLHFWLSVLVCVTKTGIETLVLCPNL